jgi:hypothetical protein
MPTEVSENTPDRSENSAAQEARLREARWWRGGLLAALVFIGLTTLYNGIAYRRLTRAQLRLAVALTQRYQSRPLPYGPGFSGPSMLPFASPWQFYGPPPWAWRHHGPRAEPQSEQDDQDGDIPQSDAQSSSGLAQNGPDARHR